jgi:NhaA family Na+:H+ antiporter
MIVCAAAAVVWANLDAAGYDKMVHARLWVNTMIGTPESGGTRVVNLHFLVNEGLMAFFFALMGKEIRDATLPGGPLSQPRRLAVPLVATAGGIVGPVAIYLAVAAAHGRLPELANGWAIPVATDIAFSYLIARLIFGRRHPAIPFLLLLAIADDLVGLVILAVCYPEAELHLSWLLVTALGVAIGVSFRRLRLYNPWWYVAVPGAFSWIGFALSGLRPALGLLPIIFLLPHGGAASGRHEKRRYSGEDALNRFEHFWKRPVEVFLGLFALLNAGVMLGSVGVASAAVLAGLLVGKPLGIWLAALAAAYVLRLGMPARVGPRELLVLGCTAGIGFTVSLFVADIAFEDGATQEAAKVGALASLGAAAAAVAAARLLRVGRMAPRAARA